MDIVDAGRIAFFIDAVGAMFGIWQAKRHIGVELVNEPGALGWSELACRDSQPATAFYASVFGWEAESSPMPGGGEYLVSNLGEHAIGGLIVMNEQWPESISAHWMTYFVVADTDESAALAGELGGSAPVAPFDVPGVGRIAAVADPNGTHFSIIALPGEPDLPAEGHAGPTGRWARRRRRCGR